jgi:transposase
LTALVRSVFKADPLNGSLFLFVNRRRDRIKALWWDRDGLVISYKRLESGSIEMVKPVAGEPTVEIDATQLAMLLAGVALSSAKLRKRYAVVG